MKKLGIALNTAITNWKIRQLESTQTKNTKDLAKARSETAAVDQTLGVEQEMMARVTGTPKDVVKAFEDAFDLARQAQVDLPYQIFNLEHALATNAHTIALTRAELPGAQVSPAASGPTARAGTPGDWMAGIGSSGSDQASAAGAVLQ
jgi:hypothetical protein